MLSVLVFSCVTLVSAQDITNVNMNFSHISIDDGLSHNTITSIFQSVTKEIWIATRDGLNKYDGFNLKKYYKITGNHNSINSNFVRSLKEDQLGRLWIATNNGICMHNKSTDDFIRYPILEGVNCSEILISKDGRIWVTTNIGVYFYETETNRFEKVKFKFKSNEINNIGNVWNIFEYESGKFYIASGKGIFDYNQFKNSLTEIPFVNKERKNISITTIYKKGEEILFGNGSDGIFAINSSEKEKILKPWNEKIFKNIAIRSINDDGDGRLWIGTYNGIYIFEANGTIGHVKPNKSNSFGLSYLSIMDIYRDQNKNMWIGTFFGGINLYNKRQNLFKNYWPSKNNNQLVNDAIRSIETSTNGELWVGTQGSGVVVLDKNKKTLTPLNVPQLENKNIHFLAKDKSNRMWTGTHKNGLFVTDLSTNQTKKINLGLYSPNNISRIFISNNNTVYVSGTGNKIYFIKGDKKVEVEIPNSKPGSPRTNIFPYKDKLFIGHTTGAIIYNPIKAKFQNTIEGFKMDSLFQGKSVTSFLKSKGGDLFIGTEGDGLFKLNSTTKTIHQYTITNKLINNTVYDLIEDDLNNIWATSNQGLMMMPLGDIKNLVNFDRSDGLPSLQFSINSSYKDEKGDLYFGTIDGLTYVNPNLIEPDTTLLPVSITDFKIGSTNYKYKKLNNKYIYLNDKWLELNLKHDQNSFYINFESFHYGQEQKIRFAYRLLNKNNDWVETNSRSAQFKNLPTGDYIFEVKSSNTAGTWIKNTETLKISINPPWWKTWQAIVAYFILTFLLFYVVYRILSERIKIKKAVKLKEFEINQVKKLNKMKLKFFTNISHEFRTPITLITGPIETLLAQEENDPKKRDLLDIAKRNSHRLLNLVNTLLDFRKAEQGFLKLSLQDLSFYDFFNEHLQAFVQAAKSKNIVLNTNIESSNEKWVFDPNKMASVIYNLIGNAIKYTPVGGIISITLKEKNDTLIFNIKNSGIKIPDSKVDKIFDRFYSIDKSESQGFGIGLALTKEIINLHNGTIEVKSDDNGTAFSIKLPIIKSFNKQSQIIEQHDYLTNSVIDRSSLEFKKYFGNEEALKVLIVDDNRDILEYISKGLEDDFHICLAENGKEALEDVESFHPNLIISDVMMPELDGIHFCKKVKTDINTSHIPFIMVTAKDSIPDELKGLESGADVYISKPFNLEALKIQIKNILHLIDKRHKDIEVQTTKADFNGLMLTKLDKKFMDKLYEYINDNIDNDQLGTDKLAQELGMSNSTLYRKIKSLTNKGSNELIRSYRLKKAVELLKLEEFNISQVAYKTGFTSVSYFSSCFKKEFGLLPKDFINKN